jgi:hypothetical protein
MRWTDMNYARERQEMHANFWEENLREKEDLEDLYVDGIFTDLKDTEREVWTDSSGSG